MSTEERTWCVYILRCADGSLYTGITNNLENRIQNHEAGRGAKYTAGRSPLELVYQEHCGDRSSALRREAEIKKMRRKEKEKLILAASPKA